GRRQGSGDRLEVAHLAYQDDVWVLAKGRSQRIRKPARVGADLTLVHDSGLGMMQVLDRVLDGKDVVGSLTVHYVDDSGKRRRLTGPCRAGDEDEAAREMGEVRNLGRYPKLLDRPDLHRDESDRSTDRVLL